MVRVFRLVLNAIDSERSKRRVARFVPRRIEIDVCACPEKKIPEGVVRVSVEKKERERERERERKRVCVKEREKERGRERKRLN